MERRRALHLGLARPTRAEIEAAAGGSCPDLVAPGLTLLFCGINPGLYTAAVGHHFARPGNRFWPALYQAGITERVYSPFEEALLLPRGIGLTNLVARATRGSNELTREELEAGAEILRRKVQRIAPRRLAILGLGAYRSAFRRPDAVLGRQPEPVGKAELWLLPSPSGANAYYQPDVLVRLLREMCGASCGPSRT